ncbi:hypothetical protein Ddye_028163 [Dipteronia dyeriana]|uniref:Uncharacterized protein n=1 Tax=Dipteronia dyeriana TaxID=168575 RepID=A0AAD9WS38_9ROSI|nr:hypothetical protein Ddye_028163 [Dipteronia dyeriana]
MNIVEASCRLPPFSRDGLQLRRRRQVAALSSSPVRYLNLDHEIIFQNMKGSGQFR